MSHSSKVGLHRQCPNFVIFDLAGTLFWSSTFQCHTLRQAVECVSHLQSLSFSSSEALIHSTRKKLSKQYGYTVALSTTLAYLDIPAREWGNFQSRIPVTEILQPDALTTRLVSSLSKCAQVILYTNMCGELTRSVLKHLGLIDAFGVIVTREDVIHPKPWPSMARNLLDTNSFNPTQTLVVGDRYHIDLEPFAELGCSVFLVRQRQDLTDLLESLLATNEALL